MMVVASLYVKLYAPNCNSLKEKRMIVRSLKDSIRRKFAVSISEVDDHDLHRSIVIGVACVSNEQSHARQVLDSVLRYIESNCEAEIMETQFEIY